MHSSTEPRQAANESGAIPTTWPGAFGAYKYSKEIVLKNVWVLLCLYLSTILVGGILTSLFPEKSTQRDGASVIVQLITLIFSTGIVVTLLRGIAGKTITYGKSLNEALGYYITMLVLTILQVVIAIASLLLFIVPFFFVVPRLLLAEYFVIDQKMNAVDALKASWRLTEGNVGKVWGTIGATVAMSLLMLTIIGIPFAIYFLFMYSAVQAVLYAYLLNHK